MLSTDDDVIEQCPEYVTSDQHIHYGCQWCHGRRVVCWFGVRNEPEERTGGETRVVLASAVQHSGGDDHAHDVLDLISEHLRIHSESREQILNL